MSSFGEFALWRGDISNVAIGAGRTVQRSGPKGDAAVFDALMLSAIAPLSPPVVPSVLASVHNER